VWGGGRKKAGRGESGEFAPDRLIPAVSDPDLGDAAPIVFRIAISHDADKPRRRLGEVMDLPSGPSENDAVTSGKVTLERLVYQWL
jgi:hypothetical protein